MADVIAFPVRAVPAAAALPVPTRVMLDHLRDAQAVAAAAGDPAALVATDALGRALAFIDYLEAGGADIVEPAGPSPTFSMRLQRAHARKLRRRMKHG